MKNRNISDLIRIFEHVNNVKISPKSLLYEQINNKQLIQESKQTESAAYKILGGNGIENPEKVINDFKTKDRTNNQILLPVMAYFYDGNNFGDVFEKLQELLSRNYSKVPVVTRNGVNINDEIINDFLRFGEYVHGLHERKIGTTISKSENSNVEQTSDKPLFDKNGIKIYEGKDRSTCIRYTQGELTGKKYSFCIGQYTSNMFQSYRDRDTATFYYVIDSNRDFDTDPLHIVVVDHNRNGFLLTDKNNNTGRIEEYGNDTDGYFNYLQSKGVPAPDIFVHRPKTQQEKEEDRVLGREKDDLEWFKKLSPDYKSKYIGRGHKLSDEQFDYLWADRNSRGFETLLMQYLNTGIPISEHQFSLITGDE
jgi:hypothetical protein